jgi:hypothetical protein
VEFFPTAVFAGAFGAFGAGFLGIWVLEVTGGTFGAVPLVTAAFPTVLAFCAARAIFSLRRSDDQAAFFQVPRRLPLRLSPATRQQLFLLRGNGFPNQTYC